MWSDQLFYIFLKTTFKDMEDHGRQLQWMMVFSLVKKNHFTISTDVKNTGVILEMVYRC